MVYPEKKFLGQEHWLVWLVKNVKTIDCDVDGLGSWLEYLPNQPIILLLGKNR